MCNTDAIPFYQKISIQYTSTNYTKNLQYEPRTVFWMHHLWVRHWHEDPLKTQWEKIVYNMHTDIPKWKLKIDVTVFRHYSGHVLVAYRHEFVWIRCQENINTMQIVSTISSQGNITYIKLSLAPAYMPLVQPSPFSENNWIIIINKNVRGLLITKLDKGSLYWVILADIQALADTLDYTLT